MDKQVGRPSKVSPQLGKRIADLLLQGATEKAAAEACGIDSASFFSWLKMGAAGDPQYTEFRRIIEDAKAQRKTWKKPGR